MSVERRKLRGGRTVYLVRWREAGKNKGRHFDRQRDAHSWDSEVRRRRRLGELDLLDAGKQTLAELYGDWHDLHVVTLSRATAESYELLWRVHIESRLGKLRLSEVTPEVIERFSRDLARDGVGVATVRRSLVVLQGMFSRAVVWGRVPRNPVAVAQKPKRQPSRRARPLSPTEVEAMRSRLSRRDATLVSVLALAGLRPGEALALCWGDIGERVIMVERAASLGEVKCTKTGSTRTVAMIAPLVKDLLEWRIASGNPGDAALIFPGHDGGVWDRGDWKNWRRRIFAPAAKAIGLPASTRPYDCRHAHASMLCKTGMNIVEVAAQLGHSAAMTLSTYAHVMQEYAGQPLVDYEAEIRSARAASSQELTGALAPGSQ